MSWLPRQIRPTTEADGRTAAEKASLVEELERQKQYFESLLAIAPTAVVVTDRDANVASWNPAAERLFGYAEAEAVGRRIDDLIAHTDELRAEAAAYKERASQEGLFRGVTRRIRKDGRLVDVELLAVPVVIDGEPAGYYAIYDDVTERKRAEDALRESERRYRQLVEQLPLVTYIDEPNEQATSIYISPQVEALLGYSPEEWLRDPELFPKLLHPDDRERVLADHERIFAAGDSSWCFEYRVLARDGRTVWVRDEAVVVKDHEGSPLYVQGFLMDITEPKLAEEALREAVGAKERLFAQAERQRQYFESLLEVSPTAVIIVGLDDNVTSWNPAAEKLFGYSREEAVGRNVDALICATEELSAEASEVNRRGSHGEFELVTRRTHRDGTLVDVQLRVAPLFIQGKLVGRYGIYHDIGELQRQKQYFASLLENSPTAIAAVGLDDRVTAWNPAAEKLFGYTREEAIGREIDDLVANLEELRAEAAAGTRRVARGEEFRLVTRRTRKDGTLVDVEVLVAPVTVHDEIHGFYAIYHDISELQRARSEAEAANRAKSAFLATMSHEIRTPMNAVIGMTGLLLGTQLTDEQREFAEIIRNSGDALLAIIDDVLDFSKIEAGKLDLESRPFDVRECVESALDVVAPRASEKGLDLAYLVDRDVPSAVVGDVTRVRQILINLLSNAVKFTETGEVVVAVEAERVGSGDEDGQARYELRFAVRDTGIGIPRDRMGALFSSFSQVDASTTRRYGGTGLGLAISKRLSEMMRGTMCVESEVGQGSTFRFTIVAEAAPSLAPAYHEDAQPQVSGKRVLVVDDNATNRQILARHAEAWGMLARETASPVEALEWIRRGDPFDLAILDMEMPEMDGVDLAAEIRRHRGAPALPLVMLTSLGRRVEDAGIQFEAYLTKPIKASHLYDVVVGLFAQPSASADDASRAPAALRQETAGEAPLRILLAEDNEVNQKLALALLARLGYRADVAGNGREALEALRRERYDVVLMDVEMPELDGLEATRHIHEEWRGEERPRIIAMTANAMQGDREICLAAGMDDYLSKPIRPEELAAALSRSEPSTVPAGGGRNVLEASALEQLVTNVGDPAFVGELIATFLADAPTLLAALRAGLEREDAEEVRRAAHTLKSSARTFGATALAELCQELEAKAKAGGLTGTSALVSEVEVEYEKVRLALDEKREELA